MNLSSVAQWPAQGLHWLQRGKPAMVTVAITTVALAALALSGPALVFLSSTVLAGGAITSAVVVLGSVAIHGIQLFSEYIPNQFRVLSGDLTLEKALPVPDPAKSLLGRIFRVSLFQFKAGGHWFENFLVNRWRQHLFGSSFCSCKHNFAADRVERARREYIEIFGSTCEFSLPLADGSHVSGAYFSAAVLQEKIEQYVGAAWSYDSQNRTMEISPPTVSDSNWTAFIGLLQRRMGWEERDSFGKKSLLTATQISAPPNREESRLQCMLILDIHSPYVLNKQYIAQCLGHGIDVCVYDTDGYASEAGMYAGADAVVDWLQQTKGLDLSKVCVTGSCGDTFVGMHLVQKYACAGLGAFLENPPLSIREVASRQGVIPLWVTENYMEAVQAPSDSPFDKHVENGFDSMAKAQTISSRSQGTICIAATSGDEMTPPSQVEQLADELAKHLSNTLYLLNELQTGGKFPDPHMMMPHLNPTVWRTFLTHFGWS